MDKLEAIANCYIENEGNVIIESDPASDTLEENDFKNCRCFLRPIIWIYNCVIIKSFVNKNSSNNNHSNNSNNSNHSLKRTQQIEASHFAYPPLHECVYWNNSEIANIIIERYSHIFNLNAKEQQRGWTALHECMFVIFNFNVRLCVCVCDGLTLKNKQTNKKGVYFGRPEIATLLMKHPKCDIFAKNWRGELPLDVAYNSPHETPYLTELAAIYHMQYASAIFQTLKYVPFELCKLISQFSY